LTEPAAFDLARSHECNHRACPFSSLINVQKKKKRRCCPRSLQKGRLVFLLARARIWPACCPSNRDHTPQDQRRRAGGHAWSRWAFRRCAERHGTGPAPGRMCWSRCGGLDCVFARAVSGPGRGGFFDHAFGAGFPEQSSDTLDVVSCTAYPDQGFVSVSVAKPVRGPVVVLVIQEWLACGPDQQGSLGRGPFFGHFFCKVRLLELCPCFPTASRQTGEDIATAHGAPCPHGPRAPARAPARSCREQVLPFSANAAGSWRPKSGPAFRCNFRVARVGAVRDGCARSTPFRLRSEIGP